LQQTHKETGNRTVACAGRSHHIYFEAWRPKLAAFPSLPVESTPRRALAEIFGMVSGSQIQTLVAQLDHDDRNSERYQFVGNLGQLCGTCDCAVFYMASTKHEHDFAKARHE
jgi:hypothetical protein